MLWNMQAYLSSLRELLLSHMCVNVAQGTLQILPLLPAQARKMTADIVQRDRVKKKKTEHLSLCPDVGQSAAHSQVFGSGLRCVVRCVR